MPRNRDEDSPPTITLELPPLPKVGDIPYFVQEIIRMEARERCDLGDGYLANEMYGDLDDEDRALYDAIPTADLRELHKQWERWYAALEATVIARLK